MDRHDRMPGHAAQPPSRSLLDASAQARRPLPFPAALPNGHSLPPSAPGLRNISSSSILQASTCTTSSQAIALAREAMRHALENEQSQAAEAGAVRAGLRSGITVDLSRKNIQTLPEEVVDIVKDELERLALSHNQLSSLPARFSECTSLRYLNLRGNQIKEFPMPLCELKCLEILDLGRNQIRILPREIAQLSSLKVLSIPKNQIRELPLCLADMVSLQVLKFEGNPISFPPSDVLRPNSSSPPNDTAARDNEVTDVATTAHIKRFLKQHAASGRNDAEILADDSMEAGETPRFAPKRAGSGRFPIKVNSGDVSDMRSPSGGVPRPPPIPSRSHYRGLSQQNTAIRRPGVMPLTIGNVNERLRSNSETLLRSERFDGRSRRMGIVSKKPSDLGTLDETRVNNRFSHYRGLSHGSAMQGTSPGSKSPATPTDPHFQRPIYVRRLSVLPERRRESKLFDPVIEAAKGILYSVFQTHPMIQVLMTLTNDGSSKRSSLEIVFYNTNSHVEELEQEIQKHDAAAGDADEILPRENESVQRACQTLVSAYGHVCTLLADNIDTFVDNGDARYIRTLLMLLYNSIMELRVTLATVTAEQVKALPAKQEVEDMNGTIRPYHREPPATPTAGRPGLPRSRTGPAAHNPPSLRLATDVASSYMGGSGRTATISSAVSRSGDAFVPAHGREMSSTDYQEVEAQFDKIFHSLQKSVDIVLQTLPGFQAQLTNGLRNAVQQRAPLGLVQDWKSLVAMCSAAIQQSEVLRNRLSVVKQKDAGARMQPSFWSQCNNFVASWTNMAHKIKSAINTIPLPPDTRVRLRPIQQSMKETSSTIMQSPWHHLFRPSGGPAGPAAGGAFNAQNVSPTQAQVPITPQSAALGPAMQATVPTTPHSAMFAAAFQGNVFDRADALIANPGISMSRSGTMTRGHSGYNSLSISSLSSDGTTGSTPPFSPNNGLGLAPPRTNSGKLST